MKDILEEFGLTEEDYKLLSSLTDTELLLPNKKRHLIHHLMRPYYRPGVPPKERLMAYKKIMEDVAPTPTVN